MRVFTTVIGLWVWAATTFGQATPAPTATDPLYVHNPPIRLVYGSRSERHRADRRTVKDAHQRMARLLTDAGIPFIRITDRDVERRGLPGGRIAIYPHNPHMTKAEVNRLIRFMDRGGKVIAFYSVPPSLTEAMGIRQIGWRKAKHADELHTIAFTDEVERGYPQSILQNSWNMQQAKPIGDAAQVVGWWRSRGGKKGQPAVLRSARGQFITHILTHGDNAEKQRFILASLVSLDRAIAHQLVNAHMQHATAPLHNGDLEAHIALFVDHLTAQQKADIASHVHKAKDDLASIAEPSSPAAPLEVARTLDVIGSATRHIQRARMLAYPKWNTPYRAMWCHDARGIPGWTWEQSAKYLADHNINMVFVNMLWGGRAYYPSDHLPPADDLPESADYLRDCLAACKKYGIELHVWKVNFNLHGAPRKFVERMRREGRLQTDKRGKELPWLAPSHPANFKLERDSMLEVVRKYDVAGIHFDYIRYPHANADYSAVARKRFQLDIASLPTSRKPTYQQWREDQVSRLVEAVSRGSRRIKPHVKISAAVFGDYPKCRTNVGQDWQLWAERGWVDFLCPMNYTENIHDLTKWTTHQRAILPNDFPLLPGVGITASNSRLSPAQTADQLMTIRVLGANGFVLYQFNPQTAAVHLPALRLGVLTDQ